MMFSYKSKKQLQMVTIIAVILFIFAGGLFVLRGYLLPEVKTYTSKAAQMKSLESQSMKLENQISTLKSQMTKEGSEKIGLLTKNEYMSAVGSLANRYSLELGKMTVAENASESGSKVIQMTLEVKGSIQNISNILDSLQNGQYICRIKEVSIRQNQDFSWLKRDFDSEKLFNWWDVTPTPTPQTNNPSAVPNNTVPEETVQGIADVMKESSASGYIKIQFESIQ